MERDAIEQWIQGVITDSRTARPTRDGHAGDAHGMQESLPTPSGTSLRQEDRAKRRHTGIKMEAAPDLSRSDPQKRLRRTLTTGTENASLSGSLREDAISLSPSIISRSDLTPSDRPRQRSSSPNRIKSSLASGTPKIKYLHESADPGSDSARQLLEFLTTDHHDGGWEPEAHETDKISAASCKCAEQLRSEGSWIIEVVRPLLQCAIGTLPLECWSVQTESVDSKYQPRYTARDTYNRKIDVVIGFPTEKWPSEYEKMTTRYPAQCFSHIAHPHTGARFIGSGVEVKASDGNLIETQVQLGIWMAGLITWAWDHRCGGETLPLPVVGCISIGERWEFYIIYGVDDSLGTNRPEVRVWGPLSDLDSRTASCKATTILAKRLRRMMEYTGSQYFPRLLRALSP